MGDYLLPDYRSRTSNVKVELDLNGYPTKDDLRNITHVHTSSFGLKTNLSSLKTDVDKLDIPKLSTVPADLAKLSNKVENDLVEETDFNALEKKVTDNKTEQDDLETKVTSNHLITETSINNLKTKFDGIALNKYEKKLIMIKKLVI